ncbi:MAG: hypothetical protein AAFQ94_08665 [Bacteroidota bacterium]
MEVSEEDIKFFDQYVAGKLSEAEQLTFEEKLRSDETFKANYDQYLNSTAAIKTIHFSNEISAVLEEEISHDRKTINLKQITIGIAASIALIIASYFVINSGENVSNLEIFYSYYDAYPALQNIRGSETDLNKEIIGAYSERKYALAIRLIESKTADKADDINLILSISFIEQKSYEKALSTLGLIDSDGLFSEQKQWYEALTLIALERTQDAITILRSFEKTHYKYEKSQEVIRQLNTANL